MTTLKELHSELEKEILDVTTLRRTGPEQAAKNYEQIMLARMARFDELARECDEVEPEAGAYDQINVEDIPRKDKIENTYDESLKTLDGLLKHVPSLLAKIERAQSVNEFLNKN